MMIKKYLHLPHIRKRCLTPTISVGKVVEPDDHDDNSDNDNAESDDINDEQFDDNIDLEPV